MSVAERDEQFECDVPKEAVGCAQHVSILVATATFATTHILYMPCVDAASYILLQWLDCDGIVIIFAEHCAARAQ